MSDGAVFARPRGAAIIRTQARRLDGLAEALDSVARQALPVTAFVVVHGSVVELESARERVRGCHPDIRFLQAPDTGRHRGYPLNQALRAVHASDVPFDFLFFLDDDDIVYPAFAATLWDALCRGSADVAYAASNRRVPGQDVGPAYAPLPVSCLLFENFIPINAYAVRMDAVRALRPCFDETLEVLEDWNFLHRLLALGLRFEPVFETLSEFRLTGDGNTPDKRDQAMWDRSWDGVQAFLKRFWRDADPGRYLACMAAFDYRRRGALSAAETRMVRETEALLSRRLREVAS